MRILQNIKLCRLSAPCCHESPSPTAAAPLAAAAAPPGGPPRILQNHANKRDVTLKSVTCHARGSAALTIRMI